MRLQQSLTSNVEPMAIWPWSFYRCLSRYLKCFNEAIELTRVGCPPIGNLSRYMNMTDQCGPFAETKIVGIKFDKSACFSNSSVTRSKPADAHRDNGINASS